MIEYLQLLTQLKLKRINRASDKTGNVKATSPKVRTLHKAPNTGSFTIETANPCSTTSEILHLLAKRIY